MSAAWPRIRRSHGHALSGVKTTSIVVRAYQFDGPVEPRTRYVVTVRGPMAAAVASKAALLLMEVEELELKRRIDRP